MVVEIEENNDHPKLIWLVQIDDVRHETINITQASSRTKAAERYCCVAVLN